MKFPVQLYIFDTMDSYIRAGFSLSRALFRKMWGPLPR